MMQLNKGIPVLIGPIEGTIFGGPFKKFIPGTRRLIGIKMAEEIDHPHDFAVDTEDFSVPAMDDMQQGLIAAIDAFADGKDVYVGCMGGIGRTGLFMGCMAQVMEDLSEHEIDRLRNVGDPVLWVREHYIPHAIETQQQQDYVRSFDTKPVIDHILSLITEEEPEPVIEYVDRYVFLSPWAAFMRWWFYR